MIECLFCSDIQPCMFHANPDAVPKLSHGSEAWLLRTLAVETPSRPYDWSRPFRPDLWESQTGQEDCSPVSDEVEHEWLAPGEGPVTVDAWVAGENPESDADAGAGPGHASDSSASAGAAADTNIGRRMDCFGRKKIMRKKRRPDSPGELGLDVDGSDGDNDEAVLSSSEQSDGDVECTFALSGSPRPTFIEDEYETDVSENHESDQGTSSEDDDNGAPSLYRPFIKRRKAIRSFATHAGRSIKTRGRVIVHKIQARKTKAAPEKTAGSKEIPERPTGDVLPADPMERRALAVARVQYVKDLFEYGYGHMRDNYHSGKCDIFFCVCVCVQGLVECVSHLYFCDRDNTGRAPPVSVEHWQRARVPRLGNRHVPAQDCRQAAV